jgi:hypothetical protein
VKNLKTIVARIEHKVKSVSDSLGRNTDAAE